MLIPIRQLGGIGLVTDSELQDLPPNAVTAASNVAFSHGRAEKFDGWTPVDFDGAGDIDLDTPAYKFQTWTSTGGSRVVFCESDVTASVLEVWDGSALVAADVEEVDTTPVTLTADVDYWQTDVLGQFCIVNNGVDVPVRSPDGLTFTQFEDWEAVFGVTGAKVIRSYKNFLIALGVGSDDNAVYWSDEAEVNAFPASWDYTLTTNLAGRNPLRAGDGGTVDARPLGDSMVVYTDYAAYAMSLVGDLRVMNFRRLFSWGLMNLNCAVDFENLHFCVGRDAIYVHDGSSPRRVADRKIEEFFFSQVSDTTKVSVSRDTINHRILIQYPTGGSTWPNKALAWDWIDNTWTVLDLGVEVQQIGEGLTLYASTDIDDLDVDIDSITSYVDEFDKTGEGRATYLLSGDTWYKAGGVSTRNGAEFHAWIERTDIDLDEALGTHAVMKYLRSVFPQVTSNAPLQFQFGASAAVGQPVNWGRVQTLAPGATKLYPRVSGRYLAYRVGSWEGTPAAGSWALTGMDWDVEPDGER